MTSWIKKVEMGISKYSHTKSTFSRLLDSLRYLSQSIMCATSKKRALFSQVSLKKIRAWSFEKFCEKCFEIQMTARVVAFCQNDAFPVSRNFWRPTFFSVESSNIATKVFLHCIKFQQFFVLWLFFYLLWDALLMILDYFLRVKVQRKVLANWVLELPTILPIK